MTRLELFDKARQRAGKLVDWTAYCSNADFQAFKNVGDEELGVLRLASHFLEAAITEARYQAES